MAVRGGGAGGEVRARGGKSRRGAIVGRGIVEGGRR